VENFDLLAARFSIQIPGDYESELRIHHKRLYLSQTGLLIIMLNVFCKIAENRATFTNINRNEGPFHYYEQAEWLGAGDGDLVSGSRSVLPHGSENNCMDL
jgi:hypothetical protein